MSNNEHDNTTEIDLSRSAELGAQFVVAVCVTTKGEETFWFLVRDAEGDHGCCCPKCAPHEQLGPLPAKTMTTTTTSEDSSR